MREGELLLRRKDMQRRALLFTGLMLVGVVLGLVLARPGLRARAVVGASLTQELQSELRVAQASHSATSDGAPTQGGRAPVRPTDHASTWGMSLATARRLIAWAIPGMSGWGTTGSAMVVYQEGQEQGGLFQRYLPFLKPSNTRWPGGQVQPKPVVIQPSTDSPSPGGTSQPAPVTPPPPVAIAAKGPLVGIYHTHDYESYISEFPGKTFTPETEDLIISNDQDHDVLKVGNELAQALSRNNITTVWSNARHQANGYLGAYDESRKTATAMLKKYPSIKMLLDLHRDSGPAKLATLGGQQVAMIDIVIGKGDSTLKQPHWEKNLELANQVKATMDQMYPGLFAAIIVKSPDTYNQDLENGAILFEIGSAQNTMEEALRGADLLANVLARIVQEGKYPH